MKYAIIKLKSHVIYFHKINFILCIKGVFYD